MTTENTIRIDDLSVEYPAHGPSAACTALQGVSLELAPGDVLGLMGESGSGKSTLGRVVSGRYLATRNGDPAPRITGGDAVVRGRSVRHAHRRDLAEISFHVGLLAQDAAATLPPSLTVVESVASPIFERDRDYSSREAGARVATLIDLVHLPLSVLEKYPYQLSSGQRQRVAIAKSLVLGPSILVADEPSAGIDATVHDAVIDLFQQLAADEKFTAIIISHDLSLLRRVTTSTAVLHRGRVVGVGPINALLADPPHPFVAGLAQALHSGPSRF